MSTRSRAGWLLMPATAVCCLALAACGSASSTSPPSATSAATTPAATASASASATSSSSAGSSASLTGTAKAIAANWVTFFNAKTPLATRVSLLENGSTFSSALQTQLKSAAASETSAKVTAVSVASSTAVVTWNLLLNGSVALPNQKGQAILQNGTWKVSDASYCGLLSLEPPAPAACKG
jgi:chitodextrinase